MMRPGHGHDHSDQLPCVSLLIPTYNHAAFIARSIESALAQDYPSDRLQIVVVDDGSTDGTQQAIQPYIDDVIYLPKEHGGLISTFNALFAAADGDLLALQSGDDMSPPSRIRRQVEAFLGRPELGLHYGDLSVIDVNDAVTAPSFWTDQKVEPHRGRIMRDLFRSNFVGGGTLMVRRSLRDRFYPLPADIGVEDWWIALRVAEVSEIDYTLEPLCLYRSHGQNVTLGATGERMWAMQRATLPLVRWVATDAQCAEAEVADWVSLLAKFLGQMDGVAANTGASTRDLVQVDGDRRSKAVRAIDGARIAWASGDTVGSVRQAVAAVAHDPFDPEARAVFSRLARNAVTSPGRPADVRGFVTFADGRELLASPALLAAYAEHISGDDDASLVVTVDTQRIDLFVELAGSLGLDDQGAAETLVEPVVGDAMAAAELWAAHTHVTLTDRPLPPPLIASVRCGVAETAKLSYLLRAQSRGVPVTDYGVSPTRGSHESTGSETTE